MGSFQNVEKCQNKVDVAEKIGLGNKFKSWQKIASENDLSFYKKTN